MSADVNTNDQIAKNTALMSIATLGSRVTGLARTWVMAFALGNSMISSAYQVANNMPNVIFDLVAGGMLGAAFIPVFMLQKEKGGEQSANDFGNNMLSLTIVILGALSILATIFAPQVIATQTFTIDNTAQVTATSIIFFRIFAIQILFYGVSGVINGILNSYRVYFLPALAPAINNLCVIISFLIYIPTSAVDAQLAIIILAGGTSLGVLIQALIQIPALLKTGYKFRFFIKLNDKALIEALKIAVPTTIYIIGTLIAFTFRNAFSLQTGDAGPSTLLYAWTWFQLPYGVIAVSLSRTMFTEMSEASAKCDKQSLCDLIHRGISTTSLLIIPMAAMMFVFSDSIMQLFQAGKFDEQAVIDTGHILMLWSLSLPFYSIWMYLYNVFASIRRFSIFAAISCILVVVQCALYYYLSNGAGISGIPMADLLYYGLCCVIGLIFIQKLVGGFNFISLIGKIIRIIAACAVGTLVAFLVESILPIEGYGMIQGLVSLVFGGSISLFVCFLFCWLFKVPEMQTVIGLTKKFLKKKD